MLNGTAAPISSARSMATDAIAASGEHAATRGEPGAQRIASDLCARHERGDGLPRQPEERQRRQARRRAEPGQQDLPAPREGADRERRDAREADEACGRDVLLEHAQRRPSVAVEQPAEHAGAEHDVRSENERAAHASQAPEPGS